MERDGNTKGLRSPFLEGGQDPSSILNSNTGTFINAWRFPQM